MMAGTLRCLVSSHTSQMHGEALFCRFPAESIQPDRNPLRDQIENAGAADALRRKAADRLIPEPVVRPDFDAADRARLGAHTGSADRALKRRPGGSRSP